MTTTASQRARFADGLRTARKKAMLSQIELAQAVNINVNVIRNAEQEKQIPKDVNVIDRLEVALHLSHGELLSLAGIQRPSDITLWYQQKWGVK